MREIIRGIALSILGGILGGVVVYWAAVPSRDLLRTKSLTIESEKGETVAMIDGSSSELRIRSRTGKEVIRLRVDESPAISLIDKSGNPAVWLGLEIRTGNPLFVVSDPAFEGYIRLGRLEGGTEAQFWGIDVKNPSDRAGIGFGVKQQGKGTYSPYAIRLECKECVPKRSNLR